MTRYEAFIEKSWRTTGLTQLLVARIRDNGRADIGFFLVDLWCLGIKDAFFHEVTGETAFRDLLAKLLPAGVCERLHPACAKKLLDGALAYAERLGFAPHRDYRKARRALGGLDASDCAETFTFGRDGKPRYVEGPHDTHERTERVLAMLKARCGAHGFDYELSDENADSDANRDDARGALRMFFEDLEAENSPGFYEFAGMVAALHVCPTLVPPTQLLVHLFDPAGHTWRDADEAKDFADDLGVYWNEIADLIAACAVAHLDNSHVNPLDIYEDDFDEIDDTNKADYFATAFSDWAAGFMRATREWPAAWGDALTRAELAPHWRVVRAWADPEIPEHLSFLRSEEKPDESVPKGDRLPFAILALLRALRPPAPPVTA